MNEWREESFKSLLINIADNRGKTCPTAKNGLPLIATNCVKNNNLFPVFEKVRYVSEETYNSWFRGHPKPGDMIFVTKGTPGRVCWTPDPVGFCIAQDMVAIRADEFKVYPKFLFAALRSPSIQGQIEGLHVGSLIPHFKKGNFNELSIPLPSRRLQHFIGDMYFDFSLKIDLLHRQNKTLEQMAETLFMQWFVVEAKEEWEEITLFDAIELVGGGTPKTSIEDYWNGQISWLSGGDISSNHKSITLKSEKTITDQGLQNSSAKLLPKFATVISARGTVGKYCILGEPMAFSQSNYGIKPKVEGCFFFTYLLLNHSVEELNSAAYGSVFDTITTSTFKGLDISIPSIQEIRNFENTVTPHFMKIFNNQTQIRTLTAMRDSLLPKLMSGEVRVDEI